MTKGQLLEIIKNVDDDTNIYIQADGGVGYIINVKIDHDEQDDFIPQVIIDYEV